MTDWSVVVLAHGDGPAPSTVRHLMAEGVDPGSILVVHNPSDDQPRARGFDQRVAVLDRARNDGYGPAMNDGIAWARRQGSEVVLLLTDDVRTSLAALRTLAEDCAAPDVALVGPLLRHAVTGRVVSAGGLLDRDGNIAHRFDALPAALREVDWVDGAVVAARVDVAQFPDDFFLYVEDVAAAVAARRAGYRVLCDTRVEARTAPGVEGRTELFRYLVWRNRIALARRELGVRAVAATVARLAAAAVVRPVTAAREAGDQAVGTAMARVYLRALSDGLTGRMGRPGRDLLH
jgi:GT2 family glycosyltransferase